MDPKSMAGDWIKDVAKQKRDNLRELACGASHLLPISIEHIPYTYTIKATTDIGFTLMNIISIPICMYVFLFVNCIYVYMQF